MRIAICDDEPIYVDRIRHLAQAYFQRRNIAVTVVSFTSGKNFADSDLQSYDIVFLDVNMDDLDGIKAAEALRQSNPKAILIFISAILEYAIMGYSVRAFRYLLKEDLESTFPVCMDELMEQLHYEGETLCVKTETGIVEIPLKNIVYIEITGRILELHLHDWSPNTYRFHGKISTLSDELQPKGFLRIHKSYLVNMAHIQQIKNYSVTFSVEEISLNCGKERYNEVMTDYLAWRGAQKWTLS